MRSTKNRKKLKSLIVFILVSILLVTGSFADFKVERTSVLADSGVAGRVRNPRRPADVTTWDCVYFGHYKNEKNGHSVEHYEGDFFPEPIKWRVLEKKDGELLLMTDQSIESIQYNQDVEKTNPETGALDLTWANSDLRAWLNDDFYNEAFNTAEKADISLSTVTADKSLEKPDLDQGPDTQDYVYILSMQEALNTKYGFVNNYVSEGTGKGGANATNTRCSVNTDYAHREHRNKKDTLGFNDGIEDKTVQPNIFGKILSSSYGAFEDTGIWWLRTVKSISTYPYYMYRVDFDGSIKQKPGPENNACVRPVIKIDENSEYVHYAGTISSNGDETGYCGDDNSDVYYEYSNNTLTIYGTGAMCNYEEFEAPWHKYHEDINTIIIDDGVTNITHNAFEDCAYVYYMYIADSVTEISGQAFSDVEMAENFLVSVEDQSAAYNICDQLGWNYTVIRSKDPLCIEIKELYDVVQTADTLSFKFDNPCAGQSYELFLDDELVQTITDDVHNPQEVIECNLGDLSAGTHMVRVNALVVGSEGLERRSLGKLIRINDEGYGNPVWEVREAEKVRWDTVYFGRYPQTEDPDGDYTCVDYKGDTRTFKTEPIKWRVLQATDDELLLMSDKSLDIRPFDKNGKNVWETCSLRKWLNSTNQTESDPGFYDRAFNEDEKAAILETDTPTNSSNTVTKDNVFLFSLSDAKKDEYGFVAAEGYARCRRSNGTDLVAMDNPKPGPQYPICVDVKTYKKQYKGKTAIIDPNDNYHDRATIYWSRDKNGGSGGRSDYPGNIDEAKNPNGNAGTGSGQYPNGNGCVRPMIRVDARSNAIDDAGTINSYGETTGPAKYYNVYIDGKLNKKVKEGNTYELPVDNTKKRSNSTSIGYIDDDNPDSVYEKGTTFSINRDRNFSTLASVTAEPAGTAIRLVNGEPHGLAFACKATVNATSNPTGNPIHSKAFEYGTLVTSYDDYVDVYDGNIDIDTEEVEGHRLYNVKFGKQDFTSKPQMYIVGITRLQQQNYAREYVARPYVIVHFEGTSEKAVIYPDSETPLFVKSAKQVAENLMKSAKWKSGGYTAWQKEWITSYTILE